MDINFNTSYGDIDFRNGDLKVVGGEALWVQRIIQTLKTNYMDYPLNPEYGVDSESYIGKGITEGLAKEMKSNLEFHLKKEGLPSSLRVIYVIRPHDIYFRIIIPGMKSLHLSFIQGKGFKVE